MALIDETRDPTKSSRKVMVERAQSVIVVTLRVDEEIAARLLRDTADAAEISVSEACDRIMFALAEPGQQGAITRTSVEHTLAGIRSDCPSGAETV